MSNTSIIIQADFTKNPELKKYCDDQGKLSIPIPQSTPVPISKVTEELSVLESIIADYSRTITLQADKKVLSILQNVHYEKIKSNIKSYRGYLEVNGMVMLIGEVNASGISERIDCGITNIDIQLLSSHALWKRQAKATRICDILSGITYEFTESFLRDNWANNYIYEDGSFPAYFPLVNYGKWHVSNPTNYTVVVEDFRPWVSPYHILVEGFCQLGWQIKSRFINEEYFRRQWMYLNSEEYGSSLTGFLIGEFEAEGSGTTSNLNSDTNFKNMSFPNESFDNGDCFNGLSIENKGLVTVSYCFQYDIEICNIENDFMVVENAITIYDENNVISGIVIVNSGSSIPPGECIQLTGQTNYELPAGHSASFSQRVRSVPINAGANTASYEGTLKNLRKGNTIVEGDIVDLGQLIDCSYSLYDMLEGLTHMFGWNFKTDPINRCIFIEPLPDYLLWDGKKRKGFMKNKNKALDWSKKLDLCSEIQYEISPIEIDECYTLRFKEDSNDAFVEALSLSQPLHSKKIITGSNNGENTDLDNPFFAPTASQNDLTIADDTFEPFVGPYIPHMWDDEPEEDETLPDRGYKFCPRIVYAFGNISNYENIDLSGRIGAWKFQGSPGESVYPFVAQIYDGSFFDGNQIQPKNLINNVYGDNRLSSNNIDLSNFSNGKILDISDNIPKNAMFCLTLSDIKSFCPQTFVLLDSECLPANVGGYYRVLEIQESIVNQPGGLTPVSITKCLPLNTCLTNGECLNEPNISYRFNADGCLVLENTGSVFNVNSDETLYSLNGGGSFSLYTDPICNINVQEVIVVRNVTYVDGCPDSNIFININIP